jgi:dTDP-4-dehydrorhamnose reductase
VKPVAIIVGSNGQDGQLLKKKLESIGYTIVGITSDTMDITNSKEVSGLISSENQKKFISLRLFITLPKKILIRI